MMKTWIQSNWPELSDQEAEEAIENLRSFLSVVADFIEQSNSKSMDQPSFGKPGIDKKQDNV